MVSSLWLLSSLVQAGQGRGGGVGGGGGGRERERKKERTKECLRCID